MSMHVPPALLIPDCRQEPLNNGLSLAEIQQRNSLIWKMCLILCIENFKQIRVQGARLAHSTLAEREMQGMAAELLFEVRN
jgi:hypothetical protein